MDKRTIKNNFLEVEFLTESLRISGLKLQGKTNLLADLSNLPPVHTPSGDFYFRGGHRLWHAPEAMPRTYAPDTGRLKIVDLPNGVHLEDQVEESTGIRKMVEIRMAPDKPSLTLIHTLINEGVWAVELAPWALTQFRLGGMVIMPQSVEKIDEAGLLPNRQISFWSYTHVNDPHLILRDDYILFKANALHPFKLGYFNPYGWLAYYIDGVFFRKTFLAQPDTVYPDNNCNSEVYCNEKFVEIESLGPLTKLNPGKSVNHIEIWDLMDELVSLPNELKKLITNS